MNKISIWVLLFYVKEKSSGSWNRLKRTGGGTKEKGISTCRPARSLKDYTLSLRSFLASA